MWLVGLGVALADPAPSRAFGGLTLGESAPAAIDGWLADHGLDCPAAPSPRRTTHQHRCADVGPLDGGLPVQALLLARLDDGPLHHVSTDRSTDDPQAATAEYQAAVARWTQRLGAPAVAEPVGRLDSAMLRYRTAWTFDDLLVELTLSRFSGTAYTVAERLDVPGAEARAATRPGSTNPHGETPKPRRNPHITPE